MSLKYPDEHIEYWSDIYVRRDARRYGISLEQFLRAPHALLARVDRIDAAARAPEQPQPPHVRQIRADNHWRQRGQVLMQKLWHGSRRRNHADAPLPSRR